MLKVKLEEIEELELSKVLRDFCVVYLNVKKLLYLIYFCYFLSFWCFDFKGGF